MTGDEFVKLLISRYGDWKHVGMRHAVVDWCAENNLCDFAALLQAVTKTWDDRYGGQPGVHFLETALKGDDEDRVWYRGLEIGHRDSGRFIPDLRRLSRENQVEYARNWEVLASPGAYGRWLAERLAKQPALETPSRPALEEPTGDYVDPEEVKAQLRKLYESVQWNKDDDA